MVGTQLLQRIHRLMGLDFLRSRPWQQAVGQGRTRRLLGAQLHEVGVMTQGQLFQQGAVIRRNVAG